jgi:hypothetical protein
VQLADRTMRGREVKSALKKHESRNMSEANVS